MIAPFSVLRTSLLANDEDDCTMRNVFGAIHRHSNIHISDDIQPSTFMYCSHGNTPGPPISFVALLNRTSATSTGTTVVLAEDEVAEDAEDEVAELTEDAAPNVEDDEACTGRDDKSSSTILLSTTANVGFTTWYVGADEGWVLGCRDGLEDG